MSTAVPAEGVSKEISGYMISSPVKVAEPTQESGQRPNIVAAKLELELSGRDML